MAIIKDNKSVKFSNGKRWFLVQSTSGNLKIEYKFDKKIYIISRTDGVPFDGVTECVGAMFLGNMKIPESLDEVIEYEVNSLASMQVEPEICFFNEFDWAFNDDKTEILIFPVFLDRGTSIVVNLPDSIAGLSEVSFGSIKRVRNANINKQNILGLSNK